MLWAKKRKWGWYLTLLRTPWFCVKLLRFHSNLGQQRHFTRSEAWLVISGYGFSVVDNLVKLIEPLSFVRVPVGSWHNVITQNLLLLEVQWGSKVCEEDIERR